MCHLGAGVLGPSVGPPMSRPASPFASPVFSGAEGYPRPEMVRVTLLKIPSHSAAPSTAPPDFGGAKFVFSGPSNSAGTKALKTGPRFWQGAGLFLALLTTVAHAVIQTAIYPSADGHVRSGAERKSFGYEVQMELRNSALSGASEAYLQFAVPPNASFAEKIVLRLFAQLADPGPAKVLVRSVVPTPWTELDLTWKTRPEQKETLGTLSIVGLSGAWYEFNVTEHVQREDASGRSTVTLALLPGDDSKNKITIQARENEQKKPELVFTRPLLAAKISFLPEKVDPPSGYLADHGAVFGARSRGLSYGWSADNTEFMRDRAESKYQRDNKNPAIKSPDRRYDFLAYMDHEKMTAPVSWELAVPNGHYQVRLVAGDAQRYDSIFNLLVEGTVIMDAVPDAKTRWFDKTATVSVIDGRLTISNGPSSSNNKLTLIEVTELENLLTQSR